MSVFWCKEYLEIMHADVTPPLLPTQSQIGAKLYFAPLTGEGAVQLVIVWISPIVIPV